MNIIGIFNNKETATIEKNKRDNIDKGGEEDNIIIYECKLNEIFTNKDLTEKFPKTKYQKQSELIKKFQETLDDELYQSVYLKQCLDVANKQIINPTEDNYLKKCLNIANKHINNLLIIIKKYTEPCKVLLNNEIKTEENKYKIVKQYIINMGVTSPYDNGTVYGVKNILPLVVGGRNPLRQISLPPSRARK
jgi:hypothetical protein